MINIEFLKRVLCMKLNKFFLFKTLLIGISLLIANPSSYGQNINPNFDSTLAKTLGGDDFGMKKYILVMLKTGSNNLADKVTRDSLFKLHLKNIGRLADSGKLIVAGPLGKNDRSYRGIFILNVTSLEEAQELLQTDPAVEQKLLEAELFHWYGSAALPEYLKSHKKIEKYSPG